MRDWRASRRRATLGTEKVDVLPVSPLLATEDLLVEAVPALDVLPHTTLFAADNLVVLVRRTDGSLAADFAVEFPFFLFLFHGISLTRERRAFENGC